MDLNEIHAFVSVVRAGSFTAAGAQRAVPKSTISRQVARLEDRLGVQLLNRTTRRLGLTEAGKGYYARCLHAIEEIENAERFALDLADRPSGTLRVAMTYDMASLYVAPLLPEFHRRYPDVALDIDMNNRHVDLVEEGFDVALRAGMLKDSNAIARRIGHSTLMLAAAPSYLEQRGRPASLDETASHRGIVLRQFLVAMRQLRLHGPDGWQPLPLEPWLTANDFDVLRQATVAGLGIGLLESNMIRHDVRQGRLERVLPDFDTGPGGGLFAVYPETHHLTPKVRAFVDFIVEMLGPKFSGDSDAS